MRPSTRALLANPRYRRLFAARSISNVGNGMGPIALAFGVLALPGASATSLSIVLAVQAVVILVVLPFGGVIGDRVGAARMISATDLILSAFVIVEGALFITGHATVPILVVIAVFAGVLNGLWYPCFIGLVPDTVDEEHQQVANSFLTIGSNLGFVVGTGVAGVLVATIGPGWAIVIDGLTFLVAGGLVFSIRHVSRPHPSEESMLGDIVHGWRVFISYRWIVVIVAAFSVVVMAWRCGEDVLGPVLANERYGGPRGWAVVLGFQTAGYLLGGVVGSRLRPRRPMLVVVLVTFTLPALLVAMAFAAPLPVLALLALLWGLAFELLGVLWFTALQSQVPRSSLSRVSSYDMLGSLVLGPVGLALAGPLEASIGLRNALLIAATVAALALGASLLSRTVRAPMQLASSE